ncbi:MAG: Hpt domain-containing protein [Candidatus Sabulitectum sp.]|nr:Hpt domain-containing protein [Candidatus Sabulitectum sp.]
MYVKYTGYSIILEFLKSLFRKFDDLGNLIIHEFLKNSPGLLASLTDHINNNNLTEAGHIAHSLKGSGANLSASLFVETAFEMEQAGKSENAPLLRKLLPIIKERYDKLIDTIKASGYNIEE